MWTNQTLREDVQTLRHAGRGRGRVPRVPVRGSPVSVQGSLASNSASLVQAWRGSDHVARLAPAGGSENGEVRPRYSSSLVYTHLIMPGGPP